MVKESDMKCKKFMTLQNMADEPSINAVSGQNFPFQTTVYYQYCGCAMLIISITALHWCFCSQVMAKTTYLPVSS